MDTLWWLPLFLALCVRTLYVCELVCSVKWNSIARYKSHSCLSLSVHKYSTFCEWYWCHTTLSVCQHICKRVHVCALNAHAYRESEPRYRIKISHFIYQHTYFNRTLLPRKPLITLKRNGCLGSFCFLQFAQTFYYGFVQKDFYIQSIRDRQTASEMERLYGEAKTGAHIHHKNRCGLARPRLDRISATNMAFIHCLIWCICAVYNNLLEMIALHVRALRWFPKMEMHSPVCKHRALWI